MRETDRKHTITLQRRRVRGIKKLVLKGLFTTYYTPEGVVWMTSEILWKSKYKNYQKLLFKS